MRRCTIVFTVAMLLISGGTVVQGRVVKDQITSPSLEDNLLGDPATREVNVYLPPGYDASTTSRYPVLYLLHGYSGNARTFLEPPTEGLYAFLAPYFPDGGIAGLLDQLITSGDAAPLIVVMPDGSNAYGGSFYTNSVLCGDYEGYVTRDVVQHVDRTYRTLAAPESRAIAGHSMGGFGALRLATLNPDVFGFAVSYGGGPFYAEVGAEAFVAVVLSENPDEMAGPALERPYTTMMFALWAAFTPNLENPPFYVDFTFEYPTGAPRPEAAARFESQCIGSLMETHLDAVSQLRDIYLDAGDRDDFGNHFQAQLLHDFLAGAGIDHTFEIYSGDHYSGVFSSIAKSLRFLTDRLDGARALAIGEESWGRIKAAIKKR